MTDHDTDTTPARTAHLRGIVRVLRDRRGRVTLLAATAITLVVVGAGLADRTVAWPALDAHALAERVRAAGVAAPLVLLGLLVVQCVVSPLPSEPLMMASGFLYGPWTGFALSWSGVVIGATVCFLTSRAVGRRMADRFVGSDKLAAFDEAFANRGWLATFWAVLAIRVFAHGSFDVVSYACGLIAFPLPLFLIATGVGAVPKVVAFTYLGVAAGEHPPWLDVLLVSGLAGLLVVPLWWRLRGRRNVRAARTDDR